VTLLGGRKKITSQKFKATYFDSLSLEANEYAASTAATSAKELSTSVAPIS